MRIFLWLDAVECGFNKKTTFSGRTPQITFGQSLTYTPCILRQTLQTTPESAEYDIFLTKMLQRQAAGLSVSLIVCVSSYPVCVQLCLHCRDVAPYRRLLLQLLTFKPQPVQQLLQRHVEPLPRGHL